MHKDDRPGGGALALCPTSAVALAGLADEVRGYVAASLAPVTRRDYATDWRLFTAWCDERGVSALPAAPATLILYLSDMAGQQSTALLSRRLTSIARRIATPATSRRRPTRWCGERGVASAAPTAPPRWARRRPGPATCGPWSPRSTARPACPASIRAPKDGPGVMRAASTVPAPPKGTIASGAGAQALVGSSCSG